MKKFSLLTLSIILATFFTSTVNAQITLYEYTTNVNGDANYVDPNLTAEKIRRVKGASGTGAGIICPIGFTSKGFSTSEIWADNMPSVVATLIPGTGVDAVVGKVGIEMRISETGPIYARLAYSTDLGVTWVDAGVDVTPPISDCGDITLYYEWDMPDFTATDKFYIRIYAFGAVLEAGRFNISQLKVYGALDMIDADGDGYGEAIDCDETNPAINPGAEEICNAIDEDCNGESDEVAVSITPTGEIYLCNNEETVELFATPGYDTYQWYKNGSPIPVTTESIIIENPGYYQVEATQGLCTAISAVQAIASSESPFANIYYPDGLDLCADDSLLIKASYDELYNWQWYRDGSPIMDETNYKMLALVPGTYYCEVTTVLGCTRNTEEIVITTCRLGNETAINNMTAYPNPANTTISFNIQTGNTTADAVLSIVSLNGQEVINMPVEIVDGLFNTSINIEALTNGIYTARLITGENQFTSRFTVVK